MKTRNQLGERVYQELRRELNSKDWAAGELMPTEAVLCERFGVSRKTIRRALATLEVEGLVSPCHGVGWRVTAGEGQTAGRVLLCSHISDPSLALFSSGVLGRARELGFGALQVDFAALTGTEANALLKDSAGMVYLAGYEVPQGVVESCRRQGVALVCAGAQAEMEYDTVSSDNAMMAQRLAQAVKKYGYSRVLVLGSSLPDHSFAIRQEEFCAAAEGLEIEVETLIAPDLWLRKEDVDSICLCITGGVEMIVAVSGVMARFLLPHLLSRGIRVPGEVGLATLGDTLTPHELLPYKLGNVTFAAHPWREIANLAVERLRMRICGDDSPPRLTLLTPDFLEIDSLLPCKWLARHGQTAGV